MDRLARVEEKQDNAMRKLERYIDDPCHLKGCDLADRVVTIETRQKTMLKFMLSIFGVFLAATGGIIAAIVWSPVTKIVVGG